MNYDSRADTIAHIETVRGFMNVLIDDMIRRAELHDQSKLASPEKEIFDEFTPKLKGSTYGSDEYKGFLSKMKVGLDHHYASNSHHPEHSAWKECDLCFAQFPQDHGFHCDKCGNFGFSTRANMKGMTLLDVVEMLCDWKAATLRHADGDIRKSIEINQKRFGYSDDLKQIFINTLAEIERPQTVGAH